MILLLLTLFQTLLSSYLAQFSGLIGNMVTCGPVLNWLELDPKGHRLLVADDSAINTPAIAAAIVVTPHSAQAHDELSLQVPVLYLLTLNA